jgi:hypothetical protein
MQNCAMYQKLTELQERETKAKNEKMVKDIVLMAHLTAMDALKAGAVTNDILSDFEDQMLSLFGLYDELGQKQSEKKHGLKRSY